MSSDWGLRLAQGWRLRGKRLLGGDRIHKVPREAGCLLAAALGPVTGAWGLLAAGPGGDTVCPFLQDTSPLDALSFSALPSLRALSLARKGYLPETRPYLV